MNRNRTKKEGRTVRVWTIDEARKAASYVAGIMWTLREHRIESLSRSRQGKQIDERPGRANRTLLLARADALRQAQEADNRFSECMNELNALDIFCLDPIRGEAFIPFLHANKLAWFVFDLFDEADHLKQWRYHDDPLDARRPIAEALAESDDVAFSV